MTPNISGNIVLNGLTDKEMARVWEMKAKHGEAFNFTPNAMQVFAPGQPVPQPQPQQPRPGYPNQPQPAPIFQFTVYTNVTFHWHDEKGLQVVHEVLSYLLKKEERAEAAGQ